MKHESSEAFCLMKYQTKDGSEEEIIWNSRDGVTPYMVLSRTGQYMSHVDFQGDVYAPCHKPAVGDRVFVNLTIETAIEIRTKDVEENWDRMSSRWDSKEEAIGVLAINDMASFAPCTPHLITVDSTMAELFATMSELRAANMALDQLLSAACDLVNVLNGEIGGTRHPTWAELLKKWQK